MLRSSDILNRATEAIQELLSYTNQTFDPQGTPTLYYLIGLQHRVNSGKIKINATMPFSLYRTNLLTASLKEVLRIAIIAGNQSNKSQVCLTALATCLQECLEIVFNTLKKSLPSESKLLAIRYFQKQEVIRRHQLKNVKE